MTDVTGIAARRHTGIAISPEQLTRMRDLRALSREDLAERTGELLFDYAGFPAVLDGRKAPDAQMARALWMALGCEPHDLIRGLPPGMARTAVPRWMRRNGGWSLDIDALDQLCSERGWMRNRLAAETSRYWFSRDSIAKIERGERRPRPRTLRAFCKILKCKPADLMPGSEPLPDGRTRDHRELLDYNEGMRAFADAQDPPVSYRNEAGRIRYTPELREAYARHLAGQHGGAALAS